MHASGCLLSAVSSFFCFSVSVFASVGFAVFIKMSPCCGEARRCMLLVSEHVFIVRLPFRNVRLSCRYKPYPFALGVEYGYHENALYAANAFETFFFKRMCGVLYFNEEFIVERKQGCLKGKLVLLFVQHVFLFVPFKLPVFTDYGFIHVQLLLIYTKKYI